MSDESVKMTRLDQLVEANIIAVHAYEVILVEKAGKGEVDCFAPGGMSTADLEAVVAHQAALLDADPVDVSKWVSGDTSNFDPAVDLDPILAAPLALSEKLPVNVFSNYLEDAVETDRVKIRAIANLYQTCFEMERDGTILWDLMHFYRAMGLPISIAELGLPTDDESLLATAEKLAPLSCSEPFGDDPATPFAWHIVGVKIANWGNKYNHVRDQYTLARELLRDRDIRVLISRIRDLKPQKIATIGHSFTMQSHWASPGTLSLS